MLPYARMARAQTLVQLTDDLLAAVRAVASGEAVAAPTVTRRLIDHFVGSAPARTRRREILGPLTAREREVLSLIAHGLSNSEIGTLLCLSEGTVKTHVNRIFTKLGLRDRVQAVILAYQTGLAPEQPPPATGR